MKLKYLFLILISLPLSECYYRVCVAKLKVKTNMDKVKESMKTKNKLKNCGNYPCFKAFFELEYNETKESVSLDVSDCLVDSPCDDEEYSNEGNWLELAKNFININEYANNELFKNLSKFRGKLTAKCCKEDYCNMSLRTRYNIGSIMPVVILGLILIKGLNA